MPKRSNLVPVSGFLAVVAAFTLGTNTRAAEPQRHAESLYLRTGTVDTSAVPAVALNRAGGEVAPAGRFVMQLDGPMTKARRALLDAAGVEIDGYLPVNAFIVRVDAVAPGALAGLDFVRWVGPYQNAWKLDPDIGQMQIGGPPLKAQQAAAEDELKLSVALFEGENLLDAIEALELAGATILASTDSGGRGAIEIRLPPVLLPALQAIPAVQFVEAAGEITLRNDQTTWVIQSNVVNDTPVWDNGLHGEGQVGGIIDSGVRGDHCMFYDPEGDPVGPDHRKFALYIGSTFPTSHGTHVAGIFVGDHEPYDASTFRNGMAYKARMTFRHTATLSSVDLYEALDIAHDAGARVHSNSWGDDSTTNYTLHCHNIDRFSWDNEDDLVIFACTNLSALRTPENAKNVLAVEASNAPSGQETRCIGGAGPTQDGRRKPEIFAPGCNIESAFYTGDVCEFWTPGGGGTSFAAPAVAGGALLVRQYYAEGYYPSGAADPNDGFVPSGTLIKATLLNAAVDMTGIAGYPNNTEGWGRLLLDRALHFIGDSRTLLVTDARRSLGAGLSTTEEATRQFDVLDSGEPLRVTLVWADYRAEINANPTPVNNLDLVVEGPGGVEYKGNVFTGGESVTGGTADALNNVEQVILSAPPAGLYTARVIGTAVQMDTQGFSLVISGDVAEPTFPCGDFDGDGDVDVTDFGAFALCYGGPFVPPALSCQPGVDADCDGDGDVDLSDFGIFSQNFTGAQ